MRNQRTPPHNPYEPRNHGKKKKKKKKKPHNRHKPKIPTFGTQNIKPLRKTHEIETPRFSSNQKIVQESTASKPNVPSRGRKESKEKRKL
jgi:hypothetical protein